MTSSERSYGEGGRFWRALRLWSEASLTARPLSYGLKRRRVEPMPAQVEVARSCRCRQRGVRPSCSPQTWPMRCRTRERSVARPRTYPPFDRHLYLAQCRLGDTRNLRRCRGYFRTGSM
jgi:hypothetical protein